MILPTVIERRLLLNYRADPVVASQLLPAPFRPRLANGSAVVGVCLVRLAAPGRRPRAENAAHRIAVSWDDAGRERYGVYIPSRHTASRVVAALGGRVFPGVHSLSRFEVRESGDDVRVAFEDGVAAVSVRATVAHEWPGGALWPGLDEASAFFRDGGPGWSVTRDPGRLDGVELRTRAWAVTPAVVRHASSSVWDGLPGVELDTALLMRDVPATWRALPSWRIAREQVIAG